jgi:hypothetical protein
MYENQQCQHDIMVIVVVKLDYNWKWIVLIEFQLNSTVYMVGYNSCNLFDNTHNVEI